MLSSRILDVPSQEVADLEVAEMLDGRLGNQLDVSSLLLAPRNEAMVSPKPLR